jgi:hypothetical protein
MYKTLEIEDNMRYNSSNKKLCFFYSYDMYGGIFYALARIRILDERQPLEEN